MSEQVLKLSPSEINMFIESPGCWVAKYLLGQELAITESMMMGSRLEDRMNYLILEEKKKKGMLLSEDDLRVIGDDFNDDFSDIPLNNSQLVNAGFKMLTPLLDFETLSLQNRVSFSKDSQTIIRGYTDYIDKDNIIDLKFTKAAPYKPRMNHIRQMVIYSIATKIKSWSLFYLVKNKDPRIMIWSHGSQLQASKQHGINIVPQEVLKKAQFDISWTIRSIKYHYELFQKTGNIILPLDFSHYRMNGINQEEVREALKLGVYRHEKSKAESRRATTTS